MKIKVIVFFSCLVFIFTGTSYGLIPSSSSPLILPAGGSMADEEGTTQSREYLPPNEPTSTQFKEDLPSNKSTTIPKEKIDFPEIEKFSSNSIQEVSTDNTSTSTEEIILNKNDPKNPKTEITQSKFNELCKQLDEEVSGVEFNYNNGKVSVEAAEDWDAQSLEVNNWVEGKTKFASEMRDLLLEKFPKTFDAVQSEKLDFPWGDLVKDEIEININDRKPTNLNNLLQKALKIENNAEKELEKVKNVSKVVENLEQKFPSVEIEDFGNLLTENNRGEIIDKFLTTIKEKCPDYLENLEKIKVGSANHSTQFANAYGGHEIKIYGEDFFEMDDPGGFGEATPERAVDLLLHEMGHVVEGAISNDYSEKYDKLLEQIGHHSTPVYSELFAEDFKNIMRTGEACAEADINGNLVDVSGNVEERTEFFQKYILNNN